MDSRHSALLSELFVGVLMNHGCLDFLNQYLPSRNWPPEDLRMVFRNREPNFFLTTFPLVVFQEQLTVIL